MRKNIQLFDWVNYLKEEEVTSIDNDLILLEKPMMKSILDYPFKVNVTTALICLSGKSEGYINLKPYSSTASSLTIILPDQILQHKCISEDFTGLFIVVSKKFINSLSIQSDSSLFISISDNPVIPLSEKDLQSTITYYTMLKDVIKRIDNPYRMETLKHLTQAFFYGTSYQFHRASTEIEKTKNEIIVNKFLTLVKTHYKHERAVAFYANESCLTPTYRIFS